MILSCLFVQATAQVPQNIIIERRVDEAVNRQLGASSRIYTGRFYHELTYPMKGSPYLTSDTMATGWLVYDGQYYPDIKMQWDVHQGFVLVRALNNHSKLILRNDLIDSFSFAGHLVKSLAANKEENLAVAGLYDFLYDGATKLIARRKKENRSVIDGGSIIYHFFDKSVYYIKKEAIYYRVGNRQDVFRLFPQHAGAIRREVRRANLSWRKDFGDAARVAISYYDKSNNP